MSKQANKTTTALTAEELTAIGFKPTTYEGQEGTFYTQTVRIAAMPWWKGSDLRDLVHGNTRFVTETDPTRTHIQTCLLNSDVWAEAGVMVDVASDEGRHLVENARKAWKATHDRA